MVGGFPASRTPHTRPTAPPGGRRLPNWQAGGPGRRPLPSPMLGPPRLKLEPRLDGVRVVGPNAPDAPLLPWASVRMRGPAVQLVDPDGRPSPGLRASWTSDHAAHLARRASDRALRRELVSGALDRLYRTDSPVPARLMAGACLGLAALGVVGAVLPAFGASILFPLGPVPTPTDRLLAAVPWLLWLVMLAVVLVIVRPAALARRGRLRVTARGLELVEDSGRSTHWPRESLASLRASFAVEITGRDGRRTRATHAPGLAATIAVLNLAWFPHHAADEEAALTRTLKRALLLWVAGSLVAGAAMAWVGAAPQTLLPIPVLNIALLTLLNAVAIPALVWASLTGRRRLEPWLIRRFSRRGARGGPA